MWYWRGLPALLFGVTSLASGALALAMPETAHAVLPDTVRQAEQLGSTRRRAADALLATPQDKPAVLPEL